jgi:N-acetylglucosaminyldiphosphoundecaprenol N-acetyl-beta-D-mannosaminyltransferase
MKENILGYVVDSFTVEGCADNVFAALSGFDRPNVCAWLACLNPHSYAMALDDKTFSQALNDANWLVPDGAGVVLASRIFGGGIKERVTGSDVFHGLHQRMNKAAGMSVFFLGATEETLRLIRDRMARDYSNVRVAGTYSPPIQTDLFR